MVVSFPVYMCTGTCTSTSKCGNQWSAVTIHIHIGNYHNNNNNSNSFNLALAIYSQASQSGHSKKWTHSLEWTKLVTDLKSHTYNILATSKKQPPLNSKQWTLSLVLKHFAIYFYLHKQTLQKPQVHVCRHSL